MVALTLRGGAASYYVNTDPVVVLDGPAGTGKTHGFVWKDHMLCRTYPRTRILWLRLERKRLTETVMVTFERDVLSRDPVVRLSESRKNRLSYIYPNRSEIILGDFSDPQKFYSGEFDAIRCFQGEELPSSEQVETLMRALRNTSSDIPYKQLAADVNPGNPAQFWNVWCNNGDAVRIKSRLQDNPRYYDENGVITDEGEEYLSFLHKMHGTNFRRLVAGEWCAEEGAIFSFDDSVHLIDGSLSQKGGMWCLRTAEREIALEWFACGVDWGDASPGAIVVMGFDRDRVGYVVEQHYRRNVTTETWAEVAASIDERFKPHVFVCDHDKDRVARFNTRLGSNYGRRVGSVAIRANKSVLAGISEMEEFIRGGQFYILRKSLAHAPDTSIADGQPRSLQEELPQYIWHKDAVSGMVTDRPDPRRADHAIDATRYLLMWVREKRYTITESPVKQFQKALARIGA